MKLDINKNIALNFNKTMRYTLMVYQIKIPGIKQCINYIAIFKR